MAVVLAVLHQPDSGGVGGEANGLGSDHHGHRAVEPGGEGPGTDGDPPGGGNTLEEVGVPEEAGGPGIGRPPVQIGGRANLDHGPVAHHRNMVAHRQCLFLVVGDEDGSGAGGGEDLADLATHPAAQVGVEVGEGLVEQDDGGGGGQRPGEGDPLLLAPGEVAGQAVLEPGEPDQVDDVGDPGGSPAAPGDAEADVGGDGQVREQGIVLEDHPHLAPFRRDE